MWWLFKKTSWFRWVDFTNKSSFKKKQKTISNQTTALNGETLTGVLCNTAYSAQVSKSGYESGVFEVAKAENEQVVVEALLNPIMPIITEREVILQPIYLSSIKAILQQKEQPN